MLRITKDNLIHRMENSNLRWQHIDGTNWSLMIGPDGSWNAVIHFPQSDGEKIDWEVDGLFCKSGEYFPGGGLQLLLGTKMKDDFLFFIDFIFQMMNLDIEKYQDLLNELEFRRLWWRKSREQLSQESATGLIGELFFFANILSTSAEDMLGAWNGPDKSMHDFSFMQNKSKINFEIKTTTSNLSPRTHLVSSLNQLDDSGLEKLVLVSIQLSIDPSGPESLLGLVEKIFSSLSIPNRKVFTKKLASYGWSPRQPDWNFTIDTSTIRMFHVHGEFPRLTKSSMKRLNLDDRILLKEYSISLNGLAMFEILDYWEKTVSEI